MSPNNVITAACVSLEIVPPQVLNIGLHLDLEVLQWSRLVGAWGVYKMRQTTIPR